MGCPPASGDHVLPCSASVLALGTPFVLHIIAIPFHLLCFALLCCLLRDRRKSVVSVCSDRLILILIYTFPRNDRSRRRKPCSGLCAKGSMLRLRSWRGCWYVCFFLFLLLYLLRWVRVSFFFIEFWLFVCDPWRGCLVETCVFVWDMTDCLWHSV